MQTVSKSYVDTAIAAAVSGHPLDSSPYVLKAGDTMTGPRCCRVTRRRRYRPRTSTTWTQAWPGWRRVNQKVSLLPSTTQVVTQPTGTQLHTNLLNGAEYATQYLTGPGNDGIANAIASPDCASGCMVVAEPTYPGTDSYNP